MHFKGIGDAEQKQVITSFTTVGEDLFVFTDLDEI